MVVPAWVEASVPLVIITAMVAGMGGLQGAVQHVVYGKPKPIGADKWDRLMAARDEHVKQQ